MGERIGKTYLSTHQRRISRQAYIDHCWINFSLLLPNKPQLLLLRHHAFSLFIRERTMDLHWNHQQPQCSPQLWPYEHVCAYTTTHNSRCVP
jgi:hypothetical protein